MGIHRQSAPKSLHSTILGRSDRSRTTASNSLANVTKNSLPVISDSKISTSPIHTIHNQETFQNSTYLEGIFVFEDHHLPDCEQLQVINSDMIEMMQKPQYSLKSRPLDDSLGVFPILTSSTATDVSKVSQPLFSVSTDSAVNRNKDDSKPTEKSKADSTADVKSPTATKSIQLEVSKLLQTSDMFLMAINQKQARITLGNFIERLLI